MRAYRTWWFIFGGLIAAPAIALAALGVRAMHADEVERAQQAQDRQRQLVRLSDAALENLVDRIVSELQIAREHPAQLSSSALLRDTPVFAIDEEGAFIFPTERVYVSAGGGAPRAIRAMRQVPASTARLVDEAERLEAQGRGGDALLTLRRAAADPRLRPWADFQRATLDLTTGNRDVADRIANLRWADPDALTPAGIPLAMVALVTSEGLPVLEQPRLLPLVQLTLHRLRTGTWWLSSDQRRTYDRQLCEWLRRSGQPANPPSDPRLAEVAEIVTIARRVIDRREAAPPSSAQLAVDDDGRQAVLIWARPDEKSEPYGVALIGQRLRTALDEALSPIFNGSAAGVLRDRAGRPVWTRGTLPRPEPSASDLHAMGGMQIAIGSIEDSHIARNYLWRYGVIALPMMLLGVGVAMTVRVVRREMALAQMQASFVAAVSHEFKSPIASIRLLMERLSGGRFGSPAAAAKYYEAVGAEADRLDGLVNRLLESQKIHAGRKQYTLEIVNVADLARSAMQTMRARAEAKGIELDLQADASVPAMPLDKAAMTDAIDNLIDNAIKYSPADTRVGIRITADRGEVRIEVADHGIGIDRDDLDRIFDPFYRGRRGDLQNVQGTGLGLSLVKAAVEAHGGTVVATSIPDRGSRFTVRLPIPENV